MPGGSALARCFCRGLFPNVLNPKVAVFYVVVLPGFVVTPEAPLGQAVTYGLASPAR